MAANKYMNLAQLTRFAASLLASHSVELQYEMNQTLIDMFYDGVDPELEAQLFKKGDEDTLAQAIKSSDEFANNDMVHLTIIDSEGVLGGITVRNEVDCEMRELGTEVFNFSDACKHFINQFRFTEVIEEINTPKVVVVGGTSATATVKQVADSTYRSSLTAYHQIKAEMNEARSQMENAKSEAAAANLVAREAQEKYEASIIRLDNIMLDFIGSTEQVADAKIYLAKCEAL